MAKISLDLFSVRDKKFELVQFWMIVPVRYIEGD